MRLNLKKLFLEEGASLSFDYTMDLSSVGLNGVYPFVSPVEVKGSARSRDGFPRLNAEVSFDFSIPCDRCAEEIDRRYHYSFSHILEQSLEDGDQDRYVEVKNDTLDLDELLREDILLELPTKFLCREDCRGLCSVCGKNLNKGPCGCTVSEGDPRMQVLKDLLH